LNEGSGGYLIARSATAEDLYALGQRILGGDAAHDLFTRVARAQGRNSGLPEATDDFIQVLERELAGSVGAASAHAMISQIAGGGVVSVDELMKIADETAQIMEYSQQLETQSRELNETAQQLRQANAKLTELGAQKDAFLSQVSHELRTPMTSIRSFSEILRETPDLSDDKARRFAGIIQDESQRLTRLLDEILDLSHLESGRVNWELQDIELQTVIDRALASTESLVNAANMRVIRKSAEAPIMVRADFDRLAQVFINLITNAVKYGQAESPTLTIHARAVGKLALIGFADNGPGIDEANHERVFEKFARLSAASLAGSAGLGLPISREIMRNLKGDLTLQANAPGAVFRVSLPLSTA